MKRHCGVILVLAVLALATTATALENAADETATELSADAGGEKPNNPAVLRYTLAYQRIGKHSYRALISSKQNQTITEYSSGGELAADMERYFRFYDAAMGKAVPAQVEVRIHLVNDWTGQVGGQLNLLDSGAHVMIGKDTDLETFKSALFHELGHFIFMQYEKEYSPTIHTIWAANAKYMNGKATGADPETLEKLAAELKPVTAAYTKAALPLHELFADCVSASMTKKPAIANFRNLAKNDSNPFKYSSSDHAFLYEAHRILDPMRGHMWQNHIKKSLNNDYALSRILAKLLDVLSVDACLKFPGYKNNAAAALRPTSYTDNVRLINAFEEA